MALLTAAKVKHYFGGLCAVADFNLDLQPGDLMGIIGPNGAGKTGLNRPPPTAHCIPHTAIPIAPKTVALPA